ncbi:MAG: hypothetical protein AAF387_20865, partial [Pseudomonadota bacterium]
AGFMEEVSIGRLFFTELPIVEGVKIDAAHDFLRVIINLYQSGEHNYLFATVALCGVAGAIVAAVVGWRQLDLLATRLPVRFCIICLCFIAIASLLDLEFFTGYYFVFLEEFAELIAALALWFAYSAIKHNHFIVNVESATEEQDENSLFSMSLDTKTN